MAIPLLTQTQPADNATGVAVTANLGLGFNEAVRVVSGTIRIYKADGTLFHTINVTDTSQVTISPTLPARVIINPNVDLHPGTGYYVLVDAGAIENLAGDDFGGIASTTQLNFTTSGTPPADTTAPLLNSTSPVDNATGVAVGSNLVLTFNEAVKAGVGNIEIHNASNGSIAKTIAITDATQISFSGSQLTINPTTDLAVGTGYYVTFASGVVRDLANNNFAGISSATAFNFTTLSSDTTAPLLTNTSPLDDAALVHPAANIVLTFDEAVKAGLGNIEIRYASDASIAHSIAVTDTNQVTFSGNQVTINPASFLLAETSYYVTFGSGVVLDLANNSFAGLSSPTAFNFTTRDMTPPYLVDTSPDHLATGVDVGTNIVLTFTEAVKAGSGNIEIRSWYAFSLVQSIPVTDTSQVTFSGSQVTINPAVDLAEGDFYYVLMGQGVIRDLANNSFYGLSYPSDFYFATTDTTPPNLTGTSPTDDAAGVAVGATLTLTFNEWIDIGSGNIEIRNASDDSIPMSIDVEDWNQVQIVGGYSLTINPIDDFVQGASYYVTMGSGVVVDYADNAFAGISSPDTFNFSIAPDITAPLLVDMSPSDDATEVDIGTNFVLTFDEDVTAGSGNIEIHKTSDGSIAQSISITDGRQVSFSGNQLTINPSSDLAEGVSYYVTIASGVIRDLANNAFAGISSTQLSFFTIPHYVIGTPGVDVLNGADNRNDSFDGLPAVDTLTGGTGDDIYYIKNYEGGQTSILIYSEDFADVSSYLPADGDLYFNLYDMHGDGGWDYLQIIHFGDPFAIFSFSTPYGTNLAPGTYPYGAAGTFTIVELEIDDTDPQNPVVLSFSITYEIDTDYQPKYLGRLNYNYAPAGAATVDAVVENPGGGNDTVVAYINYTLPTNVENLTLAGYENLNGTGNALDNIITGNWGRNVLDGEGGADTMAGLFGDDTYIVDNSSDTIVEEGFWDGTDIVLSSVTHTLALYVDNLTLTGSGNVNGTGNDLANTLIGNTGTNVLTGGDGNDLYIVGAGDSVAESLDGGYDKVESSVTHTLSDNIEDLTLTGNGNVNGTGNGSDNVLTGTNKLPGTGGQNVLTGGAGNDTLDGKTGVDTLIGGLGDDLYIIDNYEGGQNSILLQSDPGEYVGMGWNISFLTSPTSFSVTTWDGTGDGIVDAIRLHYYDYQAQPFYHWWYFEFSTTQLGTNLVPGTYTDIERFAFASSGHAGMDVYGDGRGQNWPAGSFTVTQAVFNYSSGSPVLTSLSISFEQRSDPGAPALYGTINYNYAPAGAPVLDTVLENAGEGTDTVLAAVSYTLAANLENLTLNRADHINGTGNSLDNVITGNPGNNVLDGKTGADTLVGGGGGDTFVVDNVGDVVVEVFDLYGPIYGNFDTVQSSITYALTTEVEALTLTGSANINGTGNELSNTLTGNTGNNVLNGGLGDDTFFGGGGNDTVNILAGTGSDTIGDFSAGAGTGDVVVLDGFTLGSFSAVQAAMTQNGSNTILNLGNGQTLTFLNVSKSSFAADDFTFLNVQAPPGPQPFTLPVSGAYVDTISGGRRNDNLTGTSANNRLDGQQGNDTMAGGAGDDTYLVNAPGDVVTESSSNGIDTVISSAASYTLASNVENLTLTGTVNHTAIGNGLDNLIIASSRPDTINGGAGNDILKAGTGACVLTGGIGNDIFDFDLMGAQKTITDFAVGQDLVDLRTLLAWYGGSDPVAAGAVALSAVAGGVLVSVKASAIGPLQGLVKITGVSLGDLDIGSDILWDT